MIPLIHDSLPIIHIFGVILWFRFAAQSVRATSGLCKNNLTPNFCFLIIMSRGPCGPSSLSVLSNHVACAPTR